MMSAPTMFSLLLMPSAHHELVRADTLNSTAGVEACVSLERKTIRKDEEARTVSVVDQCPVEPPGLGRILVRVDRCTRGRGSGVVARP